MVSSSREWRLKGAKEVQGEDDEGTGVILDTGCTKAMCSRHAYLLMRQGLSERQVELLPDSSAFNPTSACKSAHAALHPLTQQILSDWFCFFGAVALCANHGHPPFDRIS